MKFWEWNFWGKKSGCIKVSRQTSMYLWLRLVAGNYYVVYLLLVVIIHTTIPFPLPFCFHYRPVLRTEGNGSEIPPTCALVRESLPGASVTDPAYLCRLIRFRIVPRLLRFIPTFPCFVENRGMKQYTSKKSIRRWHTLSPSWLLQSVLTFAATSEDAAWARYYYYIHSFLHFVKFTWGCIYIYSSRYSCISIKFKIACKEQAILLEEWFEFQTTFLGKIQIPCRVEVAYPETMVQGTYVYVHKAIKGCKT